METWNYILSVKCRCLFVFFYFNFQYSSFWNLKPQTINDLVVNRVRVARSYFSVSCFVDRCLSFLFFLLAVVLSVFVLDLRYLVTPLVSSNFSYENCIKMIKGYTLQVEISIVLYCVFSLLCVI